MNLKLGSQVVALITNLRYLICSCAVIVILGIDMLQRPLSNLHIITVP